MIRRSESAATVCVLEQMNHPLADDPRFAAARPGNNQQRPVAVFHRSLLFGIKLELDSHAHIIPRTGKRKQGGSAAGGVFPVVRGG
jgi:hypothetical protein